MVESINTQIQDLTLESQPKQEQGAGLPTVLIVLGMAGSGKTTFVQRLISNLNMAGKRTYNINLDPAVLEVNFPANIDIRDSVKYKNIMKTYKLGPNGAILTCLNIFAAQFDQVVKLIEQKKSDLE